MCIRDSGCISSILGGFSAVVVGHVLDATNNNYTLVFFVGAGAYVVAVTLIHFMLPKDKAVSLDAARARV